MQGDGVGWPDLVLVRECVTHHACSCIQARLEQLEAQVAALTLRAERAERERDDARMRELAAHSRIGILTHALERVAKYLNGLTALASTGDGTVSLDCYAQRAMAEQIADALRFASTADRADAGEG